MRANASLLLLVGVVLLLPRSSSSQAPVRVEKDIEYLAPGRTEKCDLYLPAEQAGKRFPAVVIIHGGGFTGGDKGAAREQNIGNTLALNGYVGMSINYLLAAPGKPSWPQNLHDCKTAVRWLRKNADRLHVDPAHIGVIGGSAGGHLAAMVGLTGPDAKLDPKEPYGDQSCRVQAVVDLYGPAELNRFQTMFPPSVSANPEELRRASPLSQGSKDDPPVLIMHGTADKTVPLEQSQLLDAALEKAGVKHELVIVEGAPHTFHLQPKQRDLRPVVLGFFERYLK